LFINRHFTISIVGNQRFRQLVLFSAPLYDAAKTKLEKTQVIASVVEKIRRESPGGGFVKRDFHTGRWFEIGDDKSRDKVGHAIRRSVEESDKMRQSRSKLAKKLKKKIKGEESEDGDDDEAAGGESKDDSQDEIDATPFSAAATRKSIEDFLAEGKLGGNPLAAFGAARGLGGMGRIESLPPFLFQSGQPANFDQAASLFPSAHSIQQSMTSMQQTMNSMQQSISMQQTMNSMGLPHGNLLGNAGPSSFDMFARHQSGTPGAVDGLFAGAAPMMAHQFPHGAAAASSQFMSTKDTAQPGLSYMNQLDAVRDASSSFSANPYSMNPHLGFAGTGGAAQLTSLGAPFGSGSPGGGGLPQSAFLRPHGKWLYGRNIHISSCPMRRRSFID
jgi:hypothetical protein